LSHESIREVVETIVTYRGAPRLGPLDAELPIVVFPAGVDAPPFQGYEGVVLPARQREDGLVAETAVTMG